MPFMPDVYAAISGDRPIFGPRIASTWINLWCTLASNCKCSNFMEKLGGDPCAMLIDGERTRCAVRGPHS